MSKKKLNLEGLKVKSFVTSMEDGQEDTAKGGAIQPAITRPPCIVQTGPAGCLSQVVICGSRFCPTQLICPTEGFCPTEAICPTKGICPSVVGCPTDFCPTGPF